MEKIIKPSSSYTTPRTNGIHPEECSIIQKLESCKSLKQLKQIHSYVIKTKSLTLHHQTQQLMYTKIISISATTSQHTSDLNYIHSLFRELENPKIELYNTVIRSFNHKKCNPLMALLFYRDLLVKGLVGDTFTYPYVLKACALSCALEEGEQIHTQLVKNGFVLNLYVVNTLMRFYGVCGVMEGVRKVFDKSPERDLVSWTTLIQGYVEMGCWEKAVEVFYDMCKAGVTADERTMVVVVSASARIGDLSLCKKLHNYIRDHDLNSDVYVGNALVDMYFKCGDANSALKVFDEMSVKNVISWNSMILGLVHQGEFKGAMDVFKKMQNLGIKDDEITLVGVLNSCANLGMLKQGKWVHAYIDKNGIRADGSLGNALLDMYVKCGTLDEAFRVFNSMNCRDVYTYTSMIVGLAIHGQGQMAMEVFSEMSKMGIVPNNVTYIGILMACSHAGLVLEGCNYFMGMLTLHNIKPQREHYGCMVDLLGRAGLLSEAKEFIQHMGVEPDALIYGALLAACKIHGDVEVGKRVMEKVVEMEPEKGGAFILMSNLYSSFNRRRDAIKLRKTMKERKIKKTPGCSSIELDGVVYKFRKGDKSHFKAKEIYLLLDVMANHLKYNVETEPQSGFVMEYDSI